MTACGNLVRRGDAVTIKKGVVGGGSLEAAASCAGGMGVTASEVVVSCAGEVARLASTYECGGVWCSSEQCAHTVVARIGCAGAQSRYTRAKGRGERSWTRRAGCEHRTRRAPELKVQSQTTKFPTPQPPVT